MCHQYSGSRPAPDKDTDAENGAGENSEKCTGYKWMEFPCALAVQRIKNGWMDGYAHPRAWRFCSITMRREVETKTSGSDILVRAR